MWALILIPIAVILITFFKNMDTMKEPCKYLYSYEAETVDDTLDHYYLFSVEKVKNGYLCYIERIPSFRGRSTSRYMYHIIKEKHTKRYYICWTGEIRYHEQAETLCRNWANATQQFIDTGVPAPGFGGA